MKKVWLSVLGMGLSVGVTHACCGYEDAIQTALEGQGGHAIVFKHRFAVQPPQVQDKEKGKYTLAGHLIRVGGRTEQEDVIAYPHRARKRRGSKYRFANQRRHVAPHSRISDDRVR